MVKKISSFFEVPLKDFLDDEIKEQNFKIYEERIKKLPIKKQEAIFQILDLALKNVYDKEKLENIKCPLTGEEASAISMENLNTKIFPKSSHPYEIKKKFSFKIEFFLLKKDF